MSGNYPAGVTDNDEHFNLPSVGDDEEQDNDWLSYTKDEQAEFAQQVDFEQSLLPISQNARTVYINPTGTEAYTWSRAGLCAWCGYNCPGDQCLLRYCDSCSQHWLSATLADVHEGYSVTRELCAECIAFEANDNPAYSAPTPDWFESPAIIVGQAAESTADGKIEHVHSYQRVESGRTDRLRHVCSMFHCFCGDWYYM